MAQNVLYIPPMSRSSFEASPRALVLHELLDLGLRCRRHPNDEALVKRFAQLAAELTPALVERMRSLEAENERLRQAEIELPSEL